jgi:putative redox protein
MKVHARNLEGYQVEITVGKHRFIADEPLGVGEDAGPDPYALLLAALAACKVMTVQMYARRKGWSLENVAVEMGTQKTHARDCEDCESDPSALVDIIEGNMLLHGSLTEEQSGRLYEIADRCPVHRTLTSETKIRTRSTGSLPEESE